MEHSQHKELITHCNWTLCNFGLSLFLGSEEAEEYVEIGALNGLFILGRSMGFIGELYI